MYVIREVINCKPGQVRELVDRFKTMSTALKEMGHQPLRLLTDVTGEPFWTVVAELEVEVIDDFFALEKKLVANESVAKAMTNYHTFIEKGRREIYRIVS